ncbi:MAG: hypothetical protein H5T65_11795 [Chloroflexi bacterium]|nr:hypothetical protein [Chloroflexota bacterium]
MGLLSVLFALGLALLGFSLAYLLRRPDEWVAPTVMAVVGLLMTLATQTWGLRRLRRVVAPQYAVVLAATRWGRLALGVVVGLMVYFLLLAE